VGDVKDAGSEEGFLDRWSRRKQADELPASTAKEAMEQQAVPAVDEDLVQELTDADMPPIDSLDGDSDFSVFMSPGVSDELRTEALHKLFHQPEFNVTDGLNDYDEDYTSFPGLGGIVTREMKRMLKRELQRELETADAAETTAETEAPAEPEDTDFIENHNDEPNES
jgi:hypothetical protein